MTKLDDNSEYVGLAVDGNGDVQALKVATATGRLLVELNATTPTTAVIGKAKFDENAFPTALAFNGTNPQPLLIDNRSGNLWGDVLIT